MGKNIKKLSMDQFVKYQIRVPGIFSERWSDWGERMDITIEKEDESSATTTLTGYLDQSALIGLLRQLNSLGVPILSVICIELEGKCL